MAEIVIDNVSKRYENGFNALHNVSFTVAEGEFMVVVGPSGCGKTTLLRMVAGLETTTEGDIRIGGRVVNNDTPAERDLAMVFQNYALYPHMTVEQNIGYALKLRKVPKEDIRAKVRQAAEILSLTEYLDRRPGQLSGGQRQAVAIGRAVMWAKNVIILDEPTNHLGARQSQEVLNVIRAAREQGLCVLFISHTLPHVLEVCDRIVVLRLGSIVRDDPTSSYTVESLLGTITGLTK